MLNASNYMGEPLRGELEDLPLRDALIVHRQLTILEAPLAHSLPQLWSPEALPSVTRDGWGLNGLTVLQPPPAGGNRGAQLAEEAQSLLDDLLQVQRTTAGLQLGEPPF
jgi:hypothetical protein